MLSFEDFDFKEYDSCTLCPKNCKVNRNKGKKGFCRETRDLRLAWAGLHFGEEPPITGAGGSGTIFVTGCNLRCSFCQNYQISQEGMGRAVSLEEFVSLCFLLEKEGAENINIVTGSHAIPAIALGLKEAKDRGLKIPVVWNSSAYETEEAVSLLSDCVDGWLPDLKTLNPQVSSQIFYAPDYPETATRAVLKMAEISPLKIETEDEEKYPFGKLYSGVIVRHLALPSRMADSRAVLKWFAKNLRDRALISVMTQYTPVKRIGGINNPDASVGVCCSHKVVAVGFNTICCDAERRGIKPSARIKSALPFENRMLSPEEDEDLKELLLKLKIDEGFYQELVASDDWLPDFNRVQTFSSELSKPLWHWKHK